MRSALDHGVVHDFGVSAFEKAAGASPKAVNERWAIVADHSVVRIQCSAVADAYRQRSAGENNASDLHFKEKSERHFRSVASLGSSGFGGGFVLVLSIAVLVLVLVLVLETPLGYSVGSLYQSSEHRHDPF